MNFNIQRLNHPSRAFPTLNETICDKDDIGKLIQNGHDKITNAQCLRYNGIGISINGKNAIDTLTFTDHHGCVTRWRQTAAHRDIQSSDHHQPSEQTLRDFYPTA